MDIYEKRTGIILRKLGVKGKYIGYSYILFGVKIIINDPLLLTYIYKGLYTEIAIHFNTTPCCVERNIRTVKALIWESANIDLLKDIFGDIRKIPDNATFMDDLSIFVFKYRNE